MRLVQRLVSAVTLTWLVMALGTVAADASSKPGTTPLHKSPQIFQVSPVRVNLRLQPNIMILGQNFTPTTQVEIGSRAAQTIDVSDGYHLLAKLPSDLPQGSYRIQVSNEAGTVMADDSLVVDGGEGPSNTVLLAGGAFLALFVLVMRLARTPGLS
jgi:hypothetical protein